MKRGWAWLWTWVGVLSLLWILHPFLYLHHARPVAEDQAILGPANSFSPGALLDREQARHPLGVVRAHGNLLRFTGNS
jgi:hypothetical protein